MTAARTDIDASVGYYGVGLEGLMGEKHAIAHPVMLHIAGADHFVTPDKQALIHEGLDDHPKVTIHDYPGEDHGFAAEMGKRRSEKRRGSPTAAPKPSSPSISARGAMRRNPWLVAGGVLSGAAAILHLAVIAGGPDWYRFFGAGEGMARMAERGMLQPTLITLGIAAILAVWAAYAFAGAGLIRRLPLMRTALVAISAVYLLRGLILAPCSPSGRNGSMPSRSGAR